MCRTIRLLFPLTVLFVAVSLHPHYSHAQDEMAYSKPPTQGSLYWEKKGGGNIVFSVHTNKRWVALTFDDGPSPVYTPAILQILAEFHARATFFVIGDIVQKYPGLVQDIQRQGHEIGNHTEHHLQTNQVTEDDILACDQEIKQVTGTLPHLLRPPGGRMNDSILQLAKSTRHVLVMWTWDVDAKDWSQPGVQKIVHRVVDHIDPGDIVIFHDGGGKRTQTVAALRIILKQLTQENYRFETVSQMLRATIK